MRRRAWFGGAAAGGLFGATLLACQLLANIEEVPKVDAPAPPIPRVPVDPCSHEDVPPRTGLGDDRASIAAPTYLALRRLTFAANRDDGSPVGFDLDGVCTCDPRPATKLDGGPSCTTREAPSCDFDGGVDNQLRGVFKPFEPLLEASGQNIDDALNINAQIQKGQQTALLAISGYNGQPDDPEVSVGVFLSNGIVDPSGCPEARPNSDAGAAMFPDAAGSAFMWTPQWCGSDIWTYDPETTTSLGIVPRQVTSGYVTNNKLVVVSRTAFTIGFGTATLEVASPRFTATIVPRASGGFALVDGVFGGRASPAALLEGLARVRATDADGQIKALCDPSNFLWHNSYQDVRALVCGARDVAGNVPSEGIAVPCDSVSLAFRFEAAPVRVGTPRTAPLPTLESLNCVGTKLEGGLACPPSVDAR